MPHAHVRADQVDDAVGRLGEGEGEAYLRDLLHAADHPRLGTLPTLWGLEAEFENDDFREEVLHDRLEKREPIYGSLLTAIRADEAFARNLQDGFDVLCM